MEYFVNQQGSLFKLTKGEFDFIMDMIRENNPSAFFGQRTDVDANFRWQCKDLVACL